MEGSGGDYQSPFHLLHQLPRLPKYILGRSRCRDLHPKGQTVLEDYGHEGGGPP